MSLLTDLISAWELNEASGNAVDSHGSNTLTDNNTVGSGTGLVYGTARDFEASNTEYFEITDNPGLSTGDIDLTFECWVNFESFGSIPGVLGKDNSGAGQREYGLYAYTSGTNRVRWFVSSNGTSESAAAEVAGLSTGVWCQVICWHDSVNNEIGCVVNAGTPTTTSHSGGLIDGTAAFRIGDVPGNSLYMDGLIGPVRFWKRVLTSQERTDLYNGGAGLAYTDFVPPPAATNIVWQLVA